MNRRLARKIVKGQPTLRWKFQTQRRAFRRYLTWLRRKWPVTQEETE